MPAFGNADIDISTCFKIFDILLKTEEFICAALLLYSANTLSCRLPCAIYLISVWSLNVHKSSFDKLAHFDTDRPSADE